MQRLLEAARDALRRAYAPYSSFSVGAALLDHEGGIHQGVNVENASLGLSICAERTAVFRAVTEGVREFEAIAIATNGPGLTPPCGACRQVLMEFAPKLRVLLTNGTGESAEFALDELLAHPFQDFRPRES